MRGIILAAGSGTRLRPLTAFTPKALLEVAGRLLIDYPLEAMRLAGIDEVAVVVGYKEEMMLEVLDTAYEGVTTVLNERHDGGNALSVLAARTFVSDEPFVVCMGDHTISPEIVRCLLTDTREGCIVCVDRAARYPFQLDDATRVLVDRNEYVSEIGKSLGYWNAVDTGVFRMTGDVFQVIELLMDKHGIDVTISNVVSFMKDSGNPFAACDVSGSFWADVDTLEDFRSIDRLLGEKYGDRV